MKIRGIEIWLSLQNKSHVSLGVLPLDIDIPEVLTKTQWTSLRAEFTVHTTYGKSDTQAIIPTAFNMDSRFAITPEMVDKAWDELTRNIEAQVLKLSAPEAANASTQDQSERT